MASKSLAALLILPVMLLGSVALMGGGSSDSPEPQATATSGAGAGTDVTGIPEQYRQLVEDAATTCPVITAPLLAAQIEAESNWRPDVGSPAGAQGISQFTPAAWATYGKDYDGDGTNSAFDPGDAIPAQGRFMCDLVSWAKWDVKAGKISGDIIDLALAGYNAGYNRVLEFKGVPGMLEPQKYIARIHAFIPKYQVGSITPADGKNVINLVKAGKPVPLERIKPSDGGQTSGMPPAMLAKAKKAATYPNARIDRGQLCPIPGGLLRCDAAFRWAQLNAAYKAKFGTNIPVTSTYRDWAEQVAAVAVSEPGYAAEPGTSPHGWGLAIDLGYPAGNHGTREKAWLVETMPRYGWWWPTWMRRGSPDYRLNEPWHYEFAEGWVLS